jgi:hypothetical protein
VLISFRLDAGLAVPLARTAASSRSPAAIAGARYGVDRPWELALQRPMPHLLRPLGFQTSFADATAARLPLLFATVCQRLMLGQLRRDAITQDQACRTLYA